MLAPSPLLVGGASGAWTMSKRWICRIIGHRYVRTRYPGSGDDGGYYLVCKRCGNQRDDRGVAWDFGPKPGSSA